MDKEEQLTGSTTRDFATLRTTNTRSFSLSDSQFWIGMANDDEEPTATGVG